MAVDIAQLQTDLSSHGTVVFCDVHNEHSFLVVIEGVTNYDATHGIIDTHVATDYPNQTNSTLVNGVLKCEKFNQ